MPRPSLGRVQLRIRVTPECKAALGPRSSERARELLEAWAANASTPAEGTEVEEPPPPSSGPARPRRNEGR